MNQSLRLLSILVALIALVVGIVGKIAPHLFFKIPNVGFILWAITGHSLPPYISFDMYEEGRTDWLKQNDVIVSVGVKAGPRRCDHWINERVLFVMPFDANLVRTIEHPCCSSFDTNRNNNVILLQPVCTTLFIHVERNVGW